VRVFWGIAFKVERIAKAKRNFQQIWIGFTYRESTYKPLQTPPQIACPGGVEKGGGVGG